MFHRRPDTEFLFSHFSFIDAGHKSLWAHNPQSFWFWQTTLTIEVKQTQHSCTLPLVLKTQLEISLIKLSNTTTLLNQIMERVKQHLIDWNDTSLIISEYHWVFIMFHWRPGIEFLFSPFNFRDAGNKSNWTQDPQSFCFWQTIEVKQTLDST